MIDDNPFHRPPLAVPPARASAGGERMAILAAILLAATAGLVYWMSSSILDGRAATLTFGADSDQYSVLQNGWINHRAARFHPLTIIMALGWMKVFAPLTAWMSPGAILSAMFAAVGAVGVFAATATFRALLPPGYALVGGALYAFSLGIWYFSALEESKIVTATLSVLYIALYVRLRERPSMAGMVGLVVILALACMNEIVSAFLVAIPVVDTALRRGLDWRLMNWIGGQAVVVLLVWFVLEIVVNGWLIPESTHAEGQSHLNMLLYYMAKNDYGFAAQYSFILNWFMFNLVAPTSTAPLWPQAGGYFQPEFTNYFRSLPTAAAILAMAVVAAVALGEACRRRIAGPSAALLVALGAFALVRAVFFFAFNPPEPMLFSPAVTLAHWLILLVPFAGSTFPGKRLLLACLAGLLFAINGGFILGHDAWTLMGRAS